MPSTVQPMNSESTEKSSYLNKLLNQVKQERKQEREGAIETLQEKSTNELKHVDIPFIPGVEISRSTLTPLHVVEVQIPEHPDPDRQIRIREEYQLYSGNEVLLQGELDGDKVHALGKVTEIDDPSIKVKLLEGNKNSKLESQLSVSKKSSIGGVLNPTTYERREKAVQLAEQHPISSLLVGDGPVKFSHQPVANVRKLDKDLYKNERQEEGIQKALNAERLACLQGPPGTGKTRVIIEIARRAVIAGHRVIIAAETNAAVDNILIGESDDLKPDEGSLLYYHENDEVKVSRTNLNGEEVHPLAQTRFDGCPPEAADIVATTNSSADSLPRDVFDYVIVDEATQASIPSSLIPIVRGEKIILVGDHKQLPPFSHLQDKIRESLFEHLYAEGGIYGPDIGTRFDVQYRMDERIAEFPSEEFYDGDLRTAASAGRISRDLEMLPIGIFDVSGNNEQGGYSKFNTAEIDAVENQLIMLLKHKGLKGSNVGVATAHRKQAEQIEERLKASSISTIGDVTVDTFDSFQGSEREAMVLSFTRSNDDGDIGFLGDEIGQRRLNVAMTRAKGYCALIGDWDTLREGSELYERLYEYVTEIAPPKKLTV